MRVRKEVIRTGDHVYIGADGKPAVKKATPADIVRWRDSGKQMLSFGIPIPLPLEHDTKAHPLNAADLAADKVRNNTGFVQSFESDIVKDKKTGEDVHRLLSVFDIKDERTAKQVQNETIPFVSPWFSSFTDGNGRKWNDVVAHVALTTRPRITNQEPFHSVSAMLSLASPVATMPDSGIYLSRAGLLKKDGKPKHLVAFSLMSGAKLSEEEIEAAEKDEEESGPPKRKSPLDDDAEGMDEGVPDVSIYEMIGHVLKVMGFRPPDDMSEETFCRDVYETLMAKMKEMMAAKHNAGAERTEPADERGQRQPVQQESPPMYMSLIPLPREQRLVEIAKITDPEKKQMVEMFFSMHDQTEALRKNTLDKATKERSDRVEKLCGKLPADLREKVRLTLADSGAKLSLDAATGAITDPAGMFLSNMEEMASALEVTLKKASDNVTEQRPPARPDGMTDADAEKIADDMMKQGRMSGERGTKAA